MVSVLDSVVINFHVFKCCWISQIWLYLGLSIWTGDFHYVFGGVAEPVRCWRVHRDFLLPLSWGPPCLLSLPPAPPCPGVFSGKWEWLVSWSCKVLEWAEGDDSGDFSVLEGQWYLSGSVGKKMSIISKKKQVCSQKKEEGRQLPFVQQISSHTVWVVLHLA